VTLEQEVAISESIEQYALRLLHERDALRAALKEEQALAGSESRRANQTLRQRDALKAALEEAKYNVFSWTAREMKLHLERALKELEEKRLDPSQA